jgi:hypothetical protein
MTVALWICSLPLIAKFAVAPFNFWGTRRRLNEASTYSGGDPVYTDSVGFLSDAG